MRNFTDKTLEHYLKNYAHPFVNYFKNFSLNPSCKNIVCVPAKGEENNFIPLLDSLKKSAEHCKVYTSLFLLINTSSTDSRIQELNKKSLNFFQMKNDELVKSVALSSKLEVVVLNAACDEKFILKNGVGEARKLLADIALSKIQTQQLDIGYLRATDADVVVDDDYLYDYPNTQLSTQTYAFIHVASGNEAIDNATKLYDRYFRSYVEGLNFAKSPYAFYALGSALIFPIDQYLKVRGFPSCQAGEDFYFLNKLAKISSITERTNSKPILIKSRISNRVPFGTGASVGKILEQNYCEFYHPEVFKKLKNTLIQWQAYSTDMDWKKFSLTEPKFWTAEKKEKIERIAKNFPTPEKRLRAFMEYFDAFQTLKFIHHMRDHHFPSYKVFLTELFD